MTVGAVFIALGFLLALFNWIQALFTGEKAGNNPWGSESLEWTTTSPPQHGNFAQIPTMAPDWSPYGYGTNK